MTQEFAINLWAIYDLETGFVYALAGKAYSIAGTDAEKLAILKALSPTDYVTVKRQSVPSRFRIASSDGSMKEGVSSLGAVHDPNALLFEELLRSLELDLPPLPDFTGAEYRAIRQVIGKSPLTVTTILAEDPQGAIRPVVTKDDAEWLARHANGLKGM